MNIISLNWDLKCCVEVQDGVGCWSRGVKPPSGARKQYCWKFPGLVILTKSIITMIIRAQNWNNQLLCETSPPTVHFPVQQLQQRGWAECPAVPSQVSIVLQIRSDLQLKARRKNWLESEGPTSRRLRPRNIPFGLTGHCTLHHNYSHIFHWELAVCGPSDGDIQLVSNKHLSLH